MTRRAVTLLPMLFFAAALLFGQEPDKRYLYVAAPGIRDYLEYGGQGLIVFDIDRGHAFVKRIPTFLGGGKPENVKGICASAATKKIYLSTLSRLACVDLVTERVLWTIKPEGGCDRMTISPDGKVLYVPSLEGPHWNVVDGESGAVIKKLVTSAGAHNTLFGLDGSSVYLAGLRSPLLTVADPKTHDVAKTVGPFSAPVRPFTVNGAGTLCFVNVNGCLGFEVGNLKTGKMLHRVEVPGFSQGPIKRHGCPSHGVGLTPDEKEIWVCDAANQRLHVFDAAVMPPAYATGIKLRDEPGWITFTLDGAYAYPSTGDVIDVNTKKIVATLKDETGADVQSEKVLEIDFAGGVPVRNGDQFGIGRVK